MTSEPDPHTLRAAHDYAATYYRAQLASRTAYGAEAYLVSRGIDPHTAAADPWTVGFAPDGWTRLRDHLRRIAGFTDAELLATGLVTTARTGNLIDVFRNRVMFPIRDPRGRVVAFIGRDLSGDERAPKYRNTRTTAIFRKSEHLYGLAEQLADPATTAPGGAVIVEGPADVLALRRAADSTADSRPHLVVAPSGTALTAQHIALLADAVPADTPLLLAFDGDDGGKLGADRAYQLLQDWPGPVDATGLPTGRDPASLVFVEGPEQAWQAMVSARRPLASVVMEHRLTHHRLDEPEGRINAIRELTPLIADAAARDTVLAGRLGGELAQQLGMDPIDLFEVMYPPPDNPAPSVATRTSRAARAPLRPAAGPLPSFPTPEAIGHDYAHHTPARGPTATWVQRDPATGQTAWVLVEAIGDQPDRGAAWLAAEAAGRSAVIVGAANGIHVARAALNARATETGRADDAVIAVLTTFDGDQPAVGRGRFTVAWAGDCRVYGTCGATNRWFTQLTVDHVAGDTAGRTGHGLLTSTVCGGPVGTNRLDLPVAKIIMTSRAYNRLGQDLLATAVDLRSPGPARDRLRDLAGPDAAAIAVKPRNRGEHRQLPVLLAGLDAAPSPSTRAGPDRLRGARALPAGSSPAPAQRSARR
jgi:DNA primase catalytic core